MEGEALVVLDNFEQLVDAAPAVAALLAREPAVTVLVTSQAALRLTGEHEVPLAPLAAEPAAELFVRRARDVDPGDPAIAEICRRLDGLPLAIELAAARTRLLSPAAILERLGRRLDLLTGGPRDAPERQRTLRAAIEWSHDLLEEPERRAFADLAVFAGGWTLEAAEQVAGDVLDALEALVDRSLVVRAGERFQMLETIREFARERLDDAVRDRHAAWALELAEAAEAGLEGAEQAGWLRRLDAERENLVAAAEWGDAETQAADRGRPVALLAGARSGRRGPPAGRGRAGGRHGERHGRRPRAQRGRRSWPARRATTRRRARPSRRARARATTAAREARVITNLGVLDVFASDYDAAQARYEAAAAIYRELGDVRGQSIVTQNLAIVHELSGDLDGAAALLEESVELARAAGDPAHLASTLHVLGSLLARRGDVDRAVPLVLESLELAARRERADRRVPGDAGGRRRPRHRRHAAGRRRGPARGDRRGPPAGRAAGRRRAGRRPPGRLKPDALDVALERGRRTELAAAVELAMAAARSRSA